MKTASPISAALLFALLTLSSTSADAYALKTDATGTAVRWMKKVEFVVDAAIDTRLGDASAFKAIQKAISHVDAEAAGLELQVRAGEVEGVGYDFENPAANRNEIVVPESWDYEPNMIAVTVVTLNTRTHEIVDADIAFNIVHRKFQVLPEQAHGQGAPGMDTTAQALGQSHPADSDDIQNTLTHELGHALGLAHNPDVLEAVMYPGARKGETHKRRLSPDDIAGLLELYPSAPAGGGLQSATELDAPMGCSATGADAALLGLSALLPLLLRRRVTVSRCAPPVAAAVLSLGFVLLPSGSHAADVVREPAPVRQAQLVVTAEVVSSRTLPPQPGSRLLFTEVELRVRGCFKGHCPERMVTRVPGGRMGDLEQRIEGLRVPDNGEVVGLTLPPQKADSVRLPQPRMFRLSEVRDLIAFARGLEAAGLPGVLPSGSPATRSLK